MIIEVFLSGFFFLFIIVVLFVSDKFGHETFSSLDSELKFKKINEDPKKFKISIILELLEHSAIISVAVTLFFAYSQYSMVLGMIWLFSRSIEGLIQTYYKKNFWNLLNLSNKYSSSMDSDKKMLIDLGYKILKKKNITFAVSQIFFVIGTLAYSSLFVIYEIIPLFIGWLGIISSIIYGIGNMIFLVKSNSKIIWSIGGLLILIFEFILGVWLILASIIIL